MIDEYISQITAALNRLDESDSKFLNQIYTLIELHINRKKVAPAQQEEELTI